jgi:hypothetical protein
MKDTQSLPDVAAQRFGSPERRDGETPSQLLHNSGKVLWLRTAQPLQALLASPMITKSFVRY